MALPSRRLRPRFSLWAVGGLVLLTLLLVMAMVAYGAIQNYLRGESFRRLVEREAGKWLRAEVELAPLTWTGASVYVDRANADGKPASAVETLEAQSLRTGLHLRALLAREVNFDPIVITRLHLQLKKPLADAEPRPPAPPASWWQPKAVHLDGLIVDELQLDSPWVGLSQARATLEPGSTTDFVLAGGQMKLPGFPETTLNKARLRLAGDSLHLLSIDLAMEGGGSVEGEGVVSWSGPTPVDLKARWRQVRLEHFLPERWRAVLQGQASGSVHYLRESGPADVSGTIRSENATVGVLPVLQVLADFTGSERFAQVPVQELSADFARKGEALELKNVVMESSGLIRLEGACRIENQMIEGDFLVGVSPSVLRWIPANYGTVFPEDRAGYRWTTMKVSGPLSHPNEDLSVRLIAAIPGAVIEKGVEAAGQAERVIKDGVSGVLDTILGF